MNALRSLLDDISRDGYAVVRNVIGQERVSSLQRIVEKLSLSPSSERRGGLRGILQTSPEIHDLAQSKKVLELVTPIIGDSAIPVRGLFFDKTPDANWLVSWHQDLTICVQEKLEISDYGPWTIKGGTHHVQPPTEVLESMLAVRIHLDQTSAVNGALRFIPGSHALGRLSDRQILEIVQNNPSVICEVEAGDVILMRPLLLHASSAALTPSHRRVIHFEFANFNLPQGLKWLANQTS